MNKIFKLKKLMISLFIIGIGFIVLPHFSFSEDIDWETNAYGTRKGIVVDIGEATFAGTILVQDAASKTNQEAMITQLEKFKYTGNDLKVLFSNTTIGATQSGIWNIGSITTLPNVTIGNFPVSYPVTGTFYPVTQPVSATDLDIRALIATDIVTAEISEDTATETHAVLVLTSADTEYSYTLPATCIDYQAGESTNGISIKYSSYATGTAGDGCQIVPIGGYIAPSPMSNTNYASKVLYFRDSINAGTKVVISYWIRN